MNRAKAAGGKTGRRATLFSVAILFALKATALAQTATETYVFDHATGLIRSDCPSSYHSTDVTPELSANTATISEKGSCIGVDYSETLTGSYPAGPIILKSVIGSGFGTFSPAGFQTTGTLASSVTFTSSATQAIVATTGVYGPNCSSKGTEFKPPGTHSDSNTCTYASYGPDSELLILYSQGGLSLVRNQLTSKSVDLLISVYYKRVSRVVSTNVDILIDHFDMVQTVQNDATYQTPIIATKSAVVRVYPRLKDPTAQPLAGITGTLSGTGPGGTFLALQPLPPTSGTVTARGKPDPNNPDDSLNFVVDGKLFVPGNLHLTATINTPASTPDPDLSNNSGAMDVTVVAPPGRNQLLVGYVRLCYDPPTETLRCAGNAVTNTERFLNRMLPIGDKRVTYFQVLIPHKTRHAPLDLLAKTDFVAKLRAIYNVIDMKSPGMVDQLIFWLPPVTPFDCGDPARPPPPAGMNNGRFPLGSSDPVWGGGQGHITFAQDLTVYKQPNRLGPGCLTPKDANGNKFVLAHEIGHNLGLRHANRNPIPRPNSPRVPPPTIGCSASANTAWPYANSTAQQWGFNPLAQRFLPASTYDFMSYCYTPTANVWISPFDYKTLYGGAFQPRVAGPQPPSTSDLEAAPLATAGSGQVLLISGTATRDGTAGTLGAGYILASATAPISVPNGNYCLAFSGVAGSLGSSCFNVDFENDDPPDPDDDFIPVLDNVAFALNVTFPTGATRVALTTAGRTLATIAASGKAPVVTIQSPKKGDRMQGNIDIVWTGADSAGRALTYTLLYSSDGGQTWLPMDVDMTDSRMTLDTSEIMGGANVMFRVMATAGLDSTSVDVGPVTVLQTPGISGPAAVDFGGQTPGQVVEQNVTITSNGSGPLTLTSLKVSNTAFTILDAVPAFPLAAGSDFDIAIRYTPVGTGKQTGVLTIGSNDPAHPQLAVNLGAQSFSTPVPNIVADAALGFGNVMTGGSADFSFNITNAGSAGLTINSINSSSALFKVISTLPVTLGPQTDQAITVRFQPVAGGAAAATLTLASNDPVRPSVTVGATGNGFIVVTPQITAAGLLSAASYGAGGVAAGEIITLYGSNIGPAVLTGLLVQGGGTLATFSGGTQLFFDGVPAAMIFSVNGQVGAVVPYAVAGKTVTQVQVSYNGVKSNAVSVPVVKSAPGLFTAAASGKGQGAILNQDLSLNSAANPAAAGSVVVLYGTGEGQTAPAGVDGKLALAAPFPAPLLPVTVTIGGVNAPLLYAGATPSLVAGVLQVNVRVPNGLSGAQPVVVSIGGVQSPAGVTLALK